MSPRVHNTLSYSVAALTLLSVSPWNKPAALYVALLWSIHFVRRSLESLYVHRYSGRPVPPADFLVEYVYYWGFAAWIGWSLRSDAWSLPDRPSVLLGTAIFTLGEVGNAWAHQKLRHLRSGSGQAARAIPRGGLFVWVSSPHYLFEITSWCGFLVVSQLLAAAVFLVLGSVIVTTYALNRHRTYLKDFDGQAGREAYPSTRKAIFPFLL
jgi:very-long-chain enoyl-CoA reductase